MIGILARERLYGGRGGAMEERQQMRASDTDRRQVVGRPYAPGSPR
jgi:hypothetical protein